MQTIGQHVRPALAVDFRDREPGRWHSEQGRPRGVQTRRDRGALVAFPCRTRDVLFEFELN
jgi:hypothetical protein